MTELYPFHAKNAYFCSNNLKLSGFYTRIPTFCNSAQYYQKCALPRTSSDFYTFSVSYATEQLAYCFEWKTLYSSQSLVRDQRLQQTHSHSREIVQEVSLSITAIIATSVRIYYCTKCGILNYCSACDMILYFTTCGIINYCTN